MMTNKNYVNLDEVEKDEDPLKQEPRLIESYSINLKETKT